MNSFLSIKNNNLVFQTRKASNKTGAGGEDLNKFQGCGKDFTDFGVVGDFNKLLRAANKERRSTSEADGQKQMMKMKITNQLLQQAQED